MITHTNRVAFSLTAFAALAGGTAFGQTVLLDQPPSQTFSLIDYVNIETCADQFILTGSGATVADFTIWGGWKDSNVYADTFNVYFHDNDDTGPFGDVPKDLLASHLGLIPTVTATGVNFPTLVGSIPEYRLDFVLPAGVSLPAGTFWLETYCTGNLSSGQRFIWEMAPQDLVNGDLCIAWSSDTPGTTWNACTPLPETDMAIQIRSGSVATAYCFGDGTGTGCPCANENDGSLPEAGCANGQYASGAQLTGSGVASLSADSLVLQGMNTEHNQFGLYFQADNDLSPGQVWGDGLQCAGGNLKRLGTVLSDGTGYSDTTVYTSSISSKAGNIIAGDTKYYQLWYRNPFGSPCANNFNASNGLAVDWLP